MPRPELFRELSFWQISGLPIGDEKPADGLPAVRSRQEIAARNCGKKECPAAGVCHLPRADGGAMGDGCAENLETDLCGGRAGGGHELHYPRRPRRRLAARTLVRGLRIRR